MPPDMTTVDDLIDEAIAAAPDASPTQIAEIVADVLTPSQYLDALRRSLAPLARGRLAAHRAQALAPVPAGSSAKRLALQGYAMTLAERAAQVRGAMLHVGAGQYKQLGECTDRDLSFAANSRKRAALQLQDRALRYEQLRLVMQDVGAVTVAQLDDGMLMQTLGGDMILSESGSPDAETHPSSDVPALPGT